MSRIFDQLINYEKHNPTHMALRQALINDINKQVGPDIYVIAPMFFKTADNRLMIRCSDGVETGKQVAIAIAHSAGIDTIHRVGCNSVNRTFFVTLDSAEVQRLYNRIQPQNLPNKPGTPPLSAIK